MLNPTTVLRALLTTDATALAQLRSIDRVNQFINRPKQISVEEAEQFIERTNKSISDGILFYWAIALDEEPHSLIGTMCLFNFTDDRTSAEVGYELHPDYQGKGIMREHLGKVIDFAFTNVQVKSLRAIIHPENSASIRLAESHHFKLQQEVLVEGMSFYKLSK